MRHSENEQLLSMIISYILKGLNEITSHASLRSVTTEWQWQPFKATFVVDTVTVVTVRCMLRGEFTILLLMQQILSLPHAFWRKSSLTCLRDTEPIYIWFVKVRCFIKP
jgi:hypothetical protein